MVPNANLADYGLTIFALGGLFFVLGQVLPRLLDRRNGKGEGAALATVIDNNTRAVNQMSGCVQELRERLVETSARQGEQLAELLARARTG